MLITKTHCRALFAAFRNIDYDNGMVNRLEPEVEGYEVPAPWSDVARIVDTHLRRLPVEDLDILCSGEESERRAVIRNYRLPSAVDTLLTAYFNGWEEQ